jgi:hypothetical protein
MGQLRKHAIDPMDAAWLPDATCEDPVSSGRGASTTAERTLQECARPATAKASFREVARWWLWPSQGSPAATTYKFRPGPRVARA